MASFDAIWADRAGQSDIIFAAGKGGKAGTTTGNTLLLQGYDTSGASYTPMLTITSGATPTIDLASSATIGGFAPLTGGSKLSDLASTTSAEFATVISDETGTGLVVLNNAPTLVSPILGTPASGTLTNCTGLPVSSGVSGLGANVATFLATPSSANFASMITDETGTGSVVLSNTPTLVTPALGVATATSINKVTITEPLTSATLTLSDGSSLITSGGHSITLASSGITNVTLPTSGTLATTTDLSSYQPLDTELTALAGLTSAADKLPYFTGSGTASLTDITAFARTILDDANEATFKATVNLEIGTDVQAYDAGLTSLAGLTYVSDSFIKVTATDTYAVRTLAETKTDLSLNNVENTALSTWGGSANIATVGTITNGTWNAGAVTSSGDIEATGVLKATGASSEVNLWSNNYRLSYLGVHTSGSASGHSFTGGVDMASGNYFSITTGTGVELTDTNGEQSFVYIEPKINQSATAAYNAIKVDVTETATGDGSSGSGNNILWTGIGGLHKFSIDNSGNINADGTAHDLAGTLNLSGNALTSSGALTITPNAGNNLNVALSTTGDFAVNTDDLYVDTSAGKVGVNTTAPGALLEIKSNDTPNENMFSIVSGGVEKFRIDEDGDINTNTSVTWTSGGNLILNASGGIMRFQSASRMYFDDPIGIGGDPGVTPVAHLTVTGGDIKLVVNTDNVSNPPTDAELDTAFGTPATLGAGYMALIDDNGAGSNFYIVCSDGTNWWHSAFTKAV